MKKAGTARRSRGTKRPDASFQLEDALEAYYDSAPIGLAVLDTDSRYLHVNKRLAELNGLPAKAHIGRTVRDILPALADEAEAMIRRIVATGKPILNYELKGETSAKPGVHRVWVEHWHPLKNATGAVVAINVAVEEVTRRKRQEEALKKAKEEMEQKVTERTAELTAAVIALKQEAEERNRAQALLNLQRDLAIALTYPGELRETLDRILNTACHIDGFDSGGVYLVDYDKRSVDLVCHRGLSRAFVKTESHFPHSAPPALHLLKGRALFLEFSDIRRFGRSAMVREGMRSLVVMPVRHAGRVVASLNLASHTVDAVGVSSRNAIEAIAAQIGPAIARAKAETALHLNEKNLQALVSKLVVAEENERRRIAHGLHDDINQMLATAKLTLGHIAALLRRKETRDMVFKVNGYIDHVLQGTRSLTFDLASPVLQRFGLEAAVEDLCGKMTEQHGISFVFKNDKASKPLSGEIEIVVFHAVRELLRNIVDHAGARHVTVSLHRAGKHLVVAVRDDGVGFSLSKVNGFNRKGGFGLYTIRERMKHLGGSFSSEAVSPCGTRLVLSVPLGLAARKVPRGGIRVKKAHFS